MITDNFKILIFKATFHLIRRLSWDRPAFFQLHLQSCFELYSDFDSRTLATPKTSFSANDDRSHPLGQSRAFFFLHSLLRFISLTSAKDSHASSSPKSFSFDLAVGIKPSALASQNWNLSNVKEWGCFGCCSIFYRASYSWICLYFANHKARGYELRS